MSYQTTQILVILGALATALGLILAALVAGYRAGKGRQFLQQTTPALHSFPSNHRITEAVDNRSEHPPVHKRMEWSRVGLYVSLGLFLLALLGFGGYYFGLQAIGQEAAADQIAADTPVDAATQALIDKSKAMATEDAAKKSITIDTSGWKEFRDESNAYSLIYPTDYQFDPHASGREIAPLSTGIEQPKPLSTVRLMPIGLTTPVITVTTYSNPNKLAAGSFSSLYQLHNASGDTRSAFQLHGVPAVKFSQTSDEDRSEVTYVTRPNSSTIVVIEVHGPPSVMTEPSLEWETIKTVAAKLKLR